MMISSGYSKMKGKVLDNWSAQDISLAGMRVMLHAYEESMPRKKNDEQKTSRILVD